ncbi:MAG TPA: condensation domain-containing protein, partial [Candidatus Dormibacteraeota bacterium]
VQLEEVEEAMRAHPAVADAAAVLDAGPEPRLAGLLVPAVPGDDPRGEVLLALRAGLPQAWVPAALTAVAAIPRGADGEVDLSALARGDAAEPLATARPALEAAMAAVWREVMELDAVAPDDDFFELGGHSMLASRLVQRLSAELDVPVTLATLFDWPSVAELAAELETRHPGLEARLAPATGIGAAPDGADGAEPGSVPLSAAQLQLWINEQLAGGDAGDFLAAIAHRVRGPLDAGRLRDALAAVASRHQCLRAGVHLAGDLPVLRIAPRVGVDLPVVDLSGLAPAARLAMAGRLTREEASERFDLGRPPLLRARLLRLAPDDHVLVLVQHHLVTDGVSIGLLHRELAAAYAGAEPPAPPRFSDHVAWERDWLAGPEAARSLAFWRERLAGAPELALGDGRLAVTRAARATAACRTVVAPDAARRLAAVGRAERTTPFMVVTAAFAAVLARWSGQTDVVIGTTVDNRPRPGLDRVLGCFVNMVALRLDCSGDPPFAELVARARRTVLDAYTHQALPFSEVARALGGRVERSRMPVFQVTCEWVRADLALDLAGCQVESRVVPLHASRYELSLFGSLRGDALELELEHAADLWDRAVIEDRLALTAGVLEAASRQPRAPLSALLGPPGVRRAG